MLHILSLAIGRNVMHQHALNLYSIPVAQLVQIQQREPDFCNTYLWICLKLYDYRNIYFSDEPRAGEGRLVVNKRCFLSLHVTFVHASSSREEEERIRFKLDSFLNQWRSTLSIHT